MQTATVERTPPLLGYVFSQVVVVVVVVAFYSPNSLTRLMLFLAQENRLVKGRLERQERAAAAENSRKGQNGV